MRINLEKLFPFLIPFLFIFPLMKENILSFTIILLSLLVVLHVIQIKKIVLNKEVLIYTIPFWLILIVSIIHLKDISGLKPIQNSILFLILPIVFYNIPKENFSAQKINFYFDVLKYTSVLIALYYFLSFFYFYDFKDLFVYKYNIPKFRDYIYNEISLFKIHPTYFTSIIIFCITRSIDKLITFKKYSELIFIAFFTLVVLTFLAKFNMVYLFILLAYVLFFKTHLSYFKKIILFLTIISTFLILFFSIPGIKNRFDEMIDSYNNPPKGMEFDSTNIRVSIVKCSSSIAKENFWNGVNFNDVEDKLLGCYEENYDSDFYKNKKYLTHNYFMYILLGSGVFGLLIYLFYVYRVFINIKRINSFMLSVAMINIFFLNFTEDFFYRQKGLFYFSLLLFTFLMHKKQLNNHE